MNQNSTHLTLNLLAVLSLLVLGACGTVAGAGSDISKAGTAIENSADKAAQ